MTAIVFSFPGRAEALPGVGFSWEIGDSCRKPGQNSRFTGQSENRPLIDALRGRIPIELGKVLVELVVVILDVLDHAGVDRIKNVLDAADVLQNVVGLFLIGVGAVALPGIQQIRIDVPELLLNIGEFLDRLRADGLEAFDRFNVSFDKSTHLSSLFSLNV